MSLWLSQNYEKSISGCAPRAINQRTSIAYFWCAVRTLHFYRPLGAGTIARRTSGLSCGRTAEGGGSTFSKHLGLDKEDVPQEGEGGAGLGELTVKEEPPRAAVLYFPSIRCVFSHRAAGGRRIKAQARRLGQQF